MDSTKSKLKKRGVSRRNNIGSVPKVVVRPYDEVGDKISMHIILHKYWQELFDEDIDKFIWLGQDRGEPYRINKVEVQLLRWLLEDKAKIMVAELEDKIIGFMVYHYFFDSCLIVRGIYLLPKYRNAGLLARLIFSVGNVRRVLSQTLSKHEPKEIQGIKKNRHLVYENDEFKVWENVVKSRYRGEDGSSNKV